VTRAQYKLDLGDMLSVSLQGVKLPKMPVDMTYREANKRSLLGVNLIGLEQFEEGAHPS
jgi:hypothetical protein